MQWLRGRRTGVAVSCRQSYEVQVIFPTVRLDGSVTKNGTAGGGLSGKSCRLRLFSCYGSVQCCRTSASSAGPTWQFHHACAHHHPPKAICRCQEIHHPPQMPPISWRSHISSFSGQCLGACGAHTPHLWSSPILAAPTHVPCWQAVGCFFLSTSRGYNPATRTLAVIACAPRLGDSEFPNCRTGIVWSLKVTCHGSCVTRPTCPFTYMPTKVGCALTRP